MAEPQDSILAPGTRAGTVREVWAIAWPTIVGNLAVTLMWTADTILLGQVGKVELAAAGFGGVLIWTLYTFFVGLVRAVDTFVSQAKGAGRHEDCGLFTWQGLWISLLASVFLALSLWKFDWLLAPAGLEPEVVTECLRYSQARLSGAFFAIASFGLQGFFRGIGDVKTPMRVAVVINLLNIVLDLLLIFGLGPFPRWTTFGAGLATALSQLVGFCILFVLFLRPKMAELYATRSAWRPRPDALKRLVRVGTPLGLQFFGDMGSFSVFMAIMGRLGTDQLAASQIGIQVLSFSFMPANGIARAASTLVGNYFGAGDKRLAARVGWRCFQLTLLYTVVVGAVFVALQERLFSVFNDDPGVLAAGVAILALLAVFQVMDGVQMSIGGALQGAGDTTFPMVVFIGSSWFVFVPLAWLAAYPLGLGMTGGWGAAVVHISLVGGILLARWSRGKWKESVI